jgi:hypothetical protein
MTTRITHTLATSTALDGKALLVAQSTPSKRNSLLPDDLKRNDGNWHAISMGNGQHIYMRFARWQDGNPVFEAKGQSPTLLPLAGFNSFSAAAASAVKKTHHEALKPFPNNPLQNLASVPIGNTNLGQLTQQGLKAVGDIVQKAPLPILGITPEQARSVHLKTPTATRGHGVKPSPVKPLEVYTSTVFGGDVTARPALIDGKQHWVVLWEGAQGSARFTVPLKTQFGNQHLANGSYTKNLIGEFIKSAQGRQQSWAVEAQQTLRSINANVPLAQPTPRTKNLARQAVDGLAAPVKDVVLGGVESVKDLVWDKPRTLGYQLRDAWEGSFNNDPSQRYEAQARFNERLAPGYNARRGEPTPAFYAHEKPPQSRDALTPKALQNRLAQGLFGASAVEAAQNGNWLEATIGGGLSLLLRNGKKGTAPSKPGRWGVKVEPYTPPKNTPTASKTTLGKTQQQLPERTQRTITLVPGDAPGSYIPSSPSNLSPTTLKTPTQTQPVPPPSSKNTVPGRMDPVFVSSDNADLLGRPMGLRNLPPIALDRKLNAEPERHFISPDPLANEPIGSPGSTPARQRFEPSEASIVPVARLVSRPKSKLAEVLQQQPALAQQLLALEQQGWQIHVGATLQPTPLVDLKQRTIVFDRSLHNLGRSTETVQGAVQQALDAAQQGLTLNLQSQASRYNLQQLMALPNRSDSPMLKALAEDAGLQQQLRELASQGWGFAYTTQAGVLDLTAVPSQRLLVVPRGVDGKGKSITLDAAKAQISLGVVSAIKSKPLVDAALNVDRGDTTKLRVTPLPPNEKANDLAQNVRYFGPSERAEFLLVVDETGLLRYAQTDKLFDTQKARSIHTAAAGKAIFVLDGKGNMYATLDAYRLGRISIHHSSFLAGGPVAAAGELEVREGKIVGFTDQSGHYKPTLDLSGQFLKWLASKGALTHDLRVFLMGEEAAPKR